MQIRAQLRKQALSFARYWSEYQACCWEMSCPSGYHGKHVRVRFKSRARHHGNAVGQSKQKGK